MQIRFRRIAFAAFSLLFALGVQPLGAQSVLPPKTAQDVEESFRLLETTAYAQIDPQQILDGARAALVDLAHRHNVTITVPVVRDNGDDARALSALEDAIVQAAQTAHGDATDYAYAAIDGMTAVFNDRYTEFMTPEEYREFNDALDPERISGIGVLVEQDPVSSYIRVSYVLPNMPADRAGVHEGDLIVAIGSTSTKGMTIEGASNLLRGRAGTPVSIQVAPAPAATPRTLTITRSEVQPPTVIFRMLPGQIGYIWILAFGRATPDEFDVALQRLRDAGVKALVLDLRDDGGGYVDSALDISSHFVGDQAIFTQVERGDQATTIDSDGQGQVSLPMTVLVNDHTASASEITAGALQEDGAATLIGTRTFGKGIAQSLTPLPDGAAIKITTEHWLTPDHHDINLHGIDPDVVVDENHDARFGDPDHDAQLHAAVTFLQRKIAALGPH